MERCPPNPTATLKRLNVTMGLRMDNMNKNEIESPITTLLKIGDYLPNLIVDGLGDYISLDMATKTISNNLHKGMTTRRLIHLCRTNDWLILHDNTHTLPSYARANCFKIKVIHNQGMGVDSYETLLTMNGLDKLVNAVGWWLGEDN